MAEVIAYADLNVREIYSFAAAPHPCPGSSTPQRAQGYRVALGVASVVILLLMGAVITLAIWVLQGKEPKCLPDPELWLQLKHFACSSPGNSTKEDVKQCKICPENWKLHRETCYWISEHTKTWAKSQEDCRAKNSTLVVIQNTEEKVFIQNFTTEAAWLGLTVKPSENGTWEWVDGSPLEKEL
ncbi:killer cell lectin-like receptor subfamily B member 1B allele A [Paroedura picta]|uniref:killer cell lectin-like receptor subfamily B member 1B allele A n=1 Tax=Paroedura picta TaxID=143630 RepID=UPI0040570F88